MRRIFLILLSIALLAAAGYLLFLKLEARPEATSLKGTLEAKTANGITLSTETGTLAVEIPSSARLVKKDGSPASLEELLPGAVVQVSGERTSDAKIVAVEIILLEIPLLPESLTSHDAFISWLNDWKRLVPEINHSSFRKISTIPLRPTTLDSSIAGTNPIPGYREANTVSPNGKMTVNHLFYWGEPDSAVTLYGRTSTSSFEQIAFCGTPCTFDGAFWLDDERLVTTEITKASDADCGNDCPEALGVRIFNLDTKSVDLYQSAPSSTNFSKKLLAVRCQAFPPCVQEYKLYQNSSLVPGATVGLRIPREWSIGGTPEIKLIEFEGDNRQISLQTFKENPSNLIGNFLSNPSEQAIKLLDGVNCTELSGNTLKEATSVSHTILQTLGMWLVLSGSSDDPDYAMARDSLSIE